MASTNLRPQTLCPPAFRMRLLRLGLLLLSVVLVACDTGELELPGVIEGRVTGEGVALVGVTVELTGALNRETETDPTGVYRFTEIPPGAYVVSIRNLPPDAAFPAISRTATVVSAGTQQVDFQGNFIRTGSITGVVRSRGRGLGGVRVNLAGPDTATQFTRSDGTFVFPALRAGVYAVEIQGFPASVRFPGTVSEVSLQPGQSHEMAFDGIADLTATVAIERIDQVRSDGSRVPLDRRQARETLEIIALVDPGQDALEGLTLFLGDRQVSSQQFTQGGTLPTAVSGATPLRLTLAVQTDAFDSRTGVPRWLNGETLLALQLSTQEGGERAATATAQIRLENRDTFAAQIVSVGEPALGVDGRLWTGGPLQVDLLPVFYSGPRTLSSLSVEFWGGADQGRISRVQWSAGSSLRLTFPLEGPEGISGYATSAEEGDRILVVDATDDLGQRFGGLPLVVRSGLRLDLAPPQVGSFRLPQPNPATATTCCLDRWIGRNFSFASALEGIGDVGVGRFTTRIHAGPAGASPEELLALPPVERGDGLAASGHVAAYRAIAVLEDVLGNRRQVPLETAVGGETRFGVDLAPPTLQLVRGPGRLSDRVVNPGSNAAWAFSAQDSVSGLAPLPLRTTLRRWAKGDPASGVCVATDGSSSSTCLPLPSGLLRSVPEPGMGPGYFRLRAESVDRAGNLSDPIDAWALLDTAPPEVSSLFIVSHTGPGNEVLVGMDLKDDVDLHELRGYLRFASTTGQGASSTLRLPAPLPSVQVGTPFSLPLTPEISVETRFPFLRAVQQAESGGSPGTGAGGALFVANALEVAAADAAGNEGARTVALPPVPTASLSGFEPASRGASGGVLAWELSSIPLDAAADGSPRFRITATAGGDPGAFTAPFAAVHILGNRVGMDARWLGQSSALGSTGAPSGTPALQRYAWTLDWTAPPGWDGTTIELRALGLDADSIGLLSSILTVTVPARP